MSDCRNCIYKNEIDEFGNGYHCYKSGLDFDDGVCGPNCICREFYDSYNYIKDQDAIQERNKDDLLAAVAFGGDLLPDEGEGQCSDGDNSDVKTFFFCIGCIVALLVSERYGLLGLLVVFGVPYGIIKIIQEMDSDLLWKLGIGAMLIASCSSAVLHYDTKQIYSYERLLTENIYQKELWFKDQNGLMYLSIGGNRPFMPLPDGQKRINAVLAEFLSNHNKRAEQRARERAAGFDHPFHPLYDQKLEAYFLGDRIQIVSSNAPKKLFDALNEYRPVKFDWQAFERNRGE